MSSGVAAESGLSDLHLNGSKAPILVTSLSHRSHNVHISKPFKQTPLIQQQTQQIVQPSTLAYRLHLGREDYSPDTLNSKAKQVDGNGTLPRFDAAHRPPSYCQQTIIPSSAKSVQSPQDGPDVEDSLLPPANQSLSLVAIETITDCDAHKKFGNIDTQDWSVDHDGGLSLSASDEDAQCADGQTGEKLPSHQTSKMSPCSMSSKENIYPKPPEFKKKRVKQKHKKLRRSAIQRNSAIKKGTMKQNVNTKESNGINSTDPASARTKTFRLSCAPILLYTHKPNTAQSAPEFAQSRLKQRHEISRAIYSRQAVQSCVMPSRSRTLPAVENGVSSGSVNADLPRQSTSITSTSPDFSCDVLQMRLSENSRQVSQVKDSPTHCRKTMSQDWGRLIKVYLSEKQSGSLRDREGGTEYPCAPPATPTPDQLQKYKYIPSMNDVKAQRTFKNKLQALERAEQKRQEHQRGKKVKAEQQVLKDNEKVLKQRQRQEIYALNAVMTELEYNRFVTFCLSNNIQPN